MSLSVVRHNMVEGQIRTNKVRHPRLLEAMENLPREHFVPLEFWPLAYADNDCPVSQNRYLVEPLTLARLIEHAHLTPDSHVLDIGSATGYSAALLSFLARQVTALEQDTMLAVKAKDALAVLHIPNVQIVSGAMAQGYTSAAPYDAIFIQGAVDEVPATLFRQLKEGGRLMAVVRPTKGLGVATVHQKTSVGVTALPLFDTGIHSLPGFQHDKEFTW